MSTVHVNQRLNRERGWVGLGLGSYIQGVELFPFSYEVQAWGFLGWRPDRSGDLFPLSLALPSRVTFLACHTPFTLVLPCILRNNISLLPTSSVSIRLISRILFRSNNFLSCLFTFTSCPRVSLNYNHLSTTHHLNPFPPLLAMQFHFSVEKFSGSTPLCDSEFTIEK